MAEKLKDKIKKLEFQLSDEFSRSIELHTTLRMQSETINCLTQYIVDSGLADDRQEALVLTRKLWERKENDNKVQLEFEF